MSSDNVAIVANDGGLPPGTGAARRAWRCASACRRATRWRWRTSPKARRCCATTSPIGYALKDIPAGSWVHERLLRDARSARARQACRSPPSSRQPHAAARGLHLRGLPQRRRLGRHAQHPGHHAPPCNAWPASSTSRCSASRPSCCRSFPNVDDVVALEHGYGCGVAIDAPGRRDPDPHAAQHQPQPELRRRGDGGEPGLREAAARAAAAAGQHRHHRRAQRGRRRRQCRCRARRGVPAGRGACRLHVDDRLDHAPGRAAPGAPERAPARDRAGQRAGGGRAVRRQRRVLRRHRQPGRRLLHRPAGARRRQRDVLRGDRGARRHRPAHLARRDARGGATP